MLSWYLSGVVAWAFGDYLSTVREARLRVRKFVLSWSEAFVRVSHLPCRYPRLTCKSSQGPYHSRLQLGLEWIQEKAYACVCFQE